MGEFKKGDFVRRTSGSSLYTSAGKHEAGFVGQVADVKFRGGTNDIIFTNGQEGIAECYEPWQPRVGERVRYSGKSAIYSEKELVGLEGEVTELNGELVNVKWDKPIVDGIRTGGAKYIENVEPILTTTTPKQPATLKIEAGKFYKTRDGRKVGPAYIVGSCAVFGNGSNYASAVWADDGRSSHRGDKLILKDNDIIAEWIDEPVFNPSNDNAQPKFKVGDIVTPSHGGSKDNATVTKIKDGRVSVRWNNGAFGSGNGWREDELSPVLPTPTTTIVALIENGQPKPSSTPHVHASTSAAEKEAKRLAAKYKGKQFGVFTLTTTHHEPKPVYDHKWQNMAALGLKIDAIKELRAVAGLTLKGAKDAVEAWIEYENAA